MWGTTVRNRDSRLERVTRRRAPGRVVKPSQVFSAVVMLVALLAGWFAPPQQSFEQRWVAMPAAMSWEMVDRAMKSFGAAFILHAA